MAEREQPAVENVASESGVPRQHDVPVSKVCSVVTLLKQKSYCQSKVH